MIHTYRSDVASANHHVTGSVQRPDMSHANDDSETMRPEMPMTPMLVVALSPWSPGRQRVAWRYSISMPATSISKSYEQPSVP